MSVIFLPKAQEYLDALVPLLYAKGYFSFEDGAVRYVEKLIDDIIAGLPTKLHRQAPAHFDPDGEGIWYASFRHSRATTWYAFFTRYDDGGEIVYLVERIENNHTAAQYF